MVYTVRGVDRETGQPGQVVVDKPSLPDAESFARRRGLEPEEIENANGRLARRRPDGSWVFHTRDGVEARRDADGTWKVDDVDAARLTGDSARAAVVFSFLVPVIGLAMVVVYLAKNRPESATACFLAGLIGGLAWGVLLSL